MRRVIELKYLKSNRRIERAWVRESGDSIRVVQLKTENIYFVT